MAKPEYIEANRPFIDLPITGILAICAWGEARGEGATGIQAVLSVISNRVIKGGWFVDREICGMASTYHAVILKPYQFSCFLSSDPNREAMLKMAQDYPDASQLGILAVCTDLADQLVRGTLDDNTGGAVQYHTTTMKPFPTWSTSSQFAVTRTLGRHIFYKNV